MNILLDTNIVLDALLDRQPWAPDARAIWEANHDGRLSASIASTSLTNLFYISRRLTDRPRAWEAVRACLDQLSIIPIGVHELRMAANLNGPDFEDNLQIACAVRAGLDAIVTRDPRGFTAAPILVLSPADARSRIPDATRPDVGPS